VCIVLNQTTYELNPLTTTTLVSCVSVSSDDFYICVLDLVYLYFLMGLYNFIVLNQTTYELEILHMCNTSVVRALDQVSNKLQETKPLNYYHTGVLCVSSRHIS